MTQLSNQFDQTVEKGMLTDASNHNIFTAIFSPLSTGVTLKGGDAVRITQNLFITKREVYEVEEVTDTTDDVWGFVTLGIKKNEFLPGDFVEVACHSSVMYMEAATLIPRGTLVEVEPTGSKIRTATTGKIIGRAMDVASGDGALIRVLISTL